MNRSKDFKILKANPEAAGDLADAIRKGLAMAKAAKELKPIYTAIFLDEDSKESLLKLHPPKHHNVFGGHVTLVFKPSAEELKALEPHLGSTVLFDLVGGASDERGQAAKVTVPHFLRFREQAHHITISCSEGVTPVYSNELLKKGWKVIEPFIQLQGVVHHFTK